MNAFSPNLSRRSVAIFLMAAAMAALTVAVGHGESLTFSGTVVDPDGRRAAGINVHLAPVMDDHEGYELRFVRGIWADPVVTVETDSEGRWSLGATQGRLWRLLVEHPEWATMTRRVEPLWGDREMSVVTLQPALSLEVRVRAPDGGAVAGARVMGFAMGASTVDEWPFSYAAATTDEAGSARLRLPAGGPWSLEVVAEGLVPAQVKHAAGRVVAVALTSGSRLDLSLRLPSGKPAAGALAYRWRSGLTQAKADDQGRVSLFGEPGSRQRFGILSADRSLLEIELEFPSRGQPPVRQTLDLMPPLLLEVQAVTAGSLEPVSGAVAWSIDDQMAFGDAQGRLVLPVLATEKPVLLRVAAPHHVPWKETRDPGPLGAGQTTNVVMDPAASLSGRVTDVAGRALGQVVLEAWGERDLRESRLGRHTDGRSIRSGVDGQFQLVPLPIGQKLRLMAWKPGYGTAFRHLDPLVAGAHAQELELVLEPGRSVLGTVVDEEGQAIPDARIELSRSLGRSGRERAGSSRVAVASEAFAVSTADGRFELRDLEAAKFDLKVSADGFVPALVPGVEIGPGVEVGSGVDTSSGAELGAVAGPGELVVRLRLGTQIAGQVVDGSGIPLPGVSVAITTLSAGSTWQSPVTSDRDGRFLFVDLASGSYLLKAEADGFVDTSSGRVDTPLSEPLRLQLHRGRKLTVQVVDDRGLPVAGAAIRSDERSPGSSSVRGRSDTDGRFELAGLPPGQHSVSIKADGFKTRRHAVFVRPSGPPLVLETALERNITVIGQVSWPDGRPVSGVSVSVKSTAGGRRGTTDGSGQFEITEVSIGAAVVVARYGNLEAREEIEIGSESNRVSLTLPPGVELSGWILDEEREPVSAASVSLKSRDFDSEAISTADGSFTLADVPSGIRQLEVRHPGFAPYVSRFGIEVGGEPVSGVEVRLRRGALVRGCLDTSELDAVGGLPVRLKGPSFLTTQVDSAGCFQFAHVLPGAYKSEAGPYRKVLAAATFELPEELSELEIELEPVTGVEVHGRVLRGGEGVSGVLVDIYHDFTTSTRTRADGSFVLHPVPEGEWELEVSGAQGGTHRQQVDVRSGRELTIELVTGEISGQVRDADTGAGMAGVAVHLLALGEAAGHGAFWQRQPDERITTDAMGVYVIPGLATGRYQIRVKHEGYGWKFTDLDVGPAPIPGVDFELAPVQGLVLRVVDADHTEVVEWVQVALFDLAGNLLLSKNALGVEEDGRLTLDSIPAGTWEVWVASLSTAWTRFTVDHPGEETVVILSPGTTVAFDIPESVGDPEIVEFRLTAADGRQLPRRLSEPLLLPEHEGTGFRGHLGHLWPGRWVLELHHPDGRTWIATFVALAGESQELALRGDTGD